MHSPVFTPGPHSVVTADHLGDPAFAIKAADGDLIAVGCLKADAKLFAAAPELYEALLDLLKSRGAYDGTKPAEWITSEEERGIAILAKARGDQ